MAVSWQPQAKDERLLSVTLPAPGTLIAPAAAKRLALDVALRGVGRVAPNPLVGCVILDSKGGFISAGAHEQCGEAHAEVNAMKAAAAAGDGRGLFSDATLYSTLEPCAHSGRTPSCAITLVAAQFRRVVYGARDPNPKVNGQGHQILEAAGIQTEYAEDWAAECQELAEVFFVNFLKNRPFVGIKAAVSLDGAIARRGDSRQWITGGRARQYGHFLRLWYDAILVGCGTVLADNPSLDPRESLISGNVPWRVVLDPNLRVTETIKPDAIKILANTPQKVIWCATSAAWVSAKGQAFKAELDHRGASQLTIETSDGDGRFEPASLLQALKGFQISSVLIEGGAATYAAFWEAALVDRLHLFQAPVLFGAADAVRFTDATGRLDLGRPPKVAMTPLGDDWLIEAAWPPESPAPDTFKKSG